MRVLTWNLFHGRSVPESPHGLLGRFATALASWEWDVALLQEVPPWWPATLAHAAGAEHRASLTSRNSLLPLRRAIATRRPGLIKSNGGGANAILVRDRGVVEHRIHVLRRRPERRVVHAVELEHGGWVANLHAQVHSEERAQADIAEAIRVASKWAGEAPLVVGGDLNVRRPATHGLIHAGGHGVDHVLARGARAEGRAAVPDRGGLSDHAPVIVTLTEGT